MKTRIAHYIIRTAVALAPLSHGFSQVIIQHSGANDPVTEGFRLGASPEEAALGPVFNDFGFDAWSVHLRTDAEGGMYHYDLSTQEQQAMISQSWVLSATVRLLDHDQVGGHRLRVATGSKIFAVSLSAESNGDIVVSTEGLTERHTLEGGADVYHEYALIYDAVSERAALWIDGVEQLTDILGLSGALTPVMSFGSIQTISHAHWNDVTFAIIPEPATVALMTGIGALLLVGGVRWRTRKDRRN